MKLEIAKRTHAINFVWKTQDGETLLPCEMTTSHLFYSLRMLWNHTMPTEFQLPGGRYNITWLSDQQRIVDSITNLAVELSNRNIDMELPLELHGQWNYMVTILNTKEFSQNTIEYKDERALDEFYEMDGW